MLEIYSVTFWSFVCITSFHRSLSVISTQHLSNIVDYKQLQIRSASTKYYEMLRSYTETHMIEILKVPIDIMNLGTRFRHCKDIKI